MIREELKNRIFAYNRQKKAVEAERDRLSARVAELQFDRDGIADRLASSRAKMDEITGSALYKLLPAWVREKIETVFGGDAP